MTQTEIKEKTLSTPKFNNSTTNGNGKEFFKELARNRQQLITDVYEYEKKAESEKK